jgi:hypothetical protein
MAMNLIQFQAGMSLSELFEQFGTEEQCERALETARWPQGFVCPHCNGTTHSRFSDFPMVLGGTGSVVVVVNKSVYVQAPYSTRQNYRCADGSRHSF